MTPDKKPTEPEKQPDELTDADLDKAAGGIIAILIGKTETPKTIDPIDPPITPSGALDLNDLKRPK